MAVIKAKRKEGELEVLVKAKELCKYTLDMCKAEKHFPKRDRWILTQKIASEAIDTYGCIRKANAIRVTERCDYELRRTYQMEAYAHTDTLLGLIEIASVMDNVCINAEHWTGLADEVQKRMLGWRKSDRERYKDYRCDINIKEQPNMDGLPLE